jgi:Leucine-rich repeat (LRR) protein
LGNLRILRCGGVYNQPWAISDMAFVQGLHKITRLDISYNRINELKGLDALKDLQKFDISGNQIRELKGLEALTRFTIISNFQQSHH